MATAETAELVARLSLKDDFSRTLKTIEGNTKRSSSIMRNALSAGIGRSASRIAERGVRALFGQVTSGLDSLAELESATTSVDGAIKQMGLTGQVTSKEIAGWANDIERDIEAAFDDKEITQAATTLIRFGKVTPQNLKPALTVIADLATKTGSVESAATLLAKALADPTKAAGKLARQGIILTKAQEAQIKAMMEAGDVAGAQKVILDALATATEGAAKAANGPFVDSQRVLADVVEDAQRALATGFLPVLMEVRDILSTELAKPGTLDNIKKFGEGLAGGLKGLIQTARGLPWDLIGDSLSTAAAGGKALLDSFLGLPPWVQGAVATGWGLNKLTGGAVVSIGIDLIKGAGGTLFDKFFARGSSAANPLYVRDILGGKGGPGGIIPTGGKGAVDLISKVFIVGMVAEVADMIAKPLFAEGDKLGDQIWGDQDPQWAKDLRGLAEFWGPNWLENTGLVPKKPPANAKNVPFVDKGDSGDRGVLTPKEQQIADKAEAAAKKTQERIDAARDAIETSRIATVTAIGKPPPMSPDERQELKDIGAKNDRARDAIEASRIALSTKLGDVRTGVDNNKTATDRARDAVEASRIALASKLDTVKTGVDNTKAATDRARDSIETARIANATAIAGVVGGGHSDADRIVTAIKNKDFSVKVTVNSSGSPDDRDKPKVTVQTGGNVTRATDPRTNGSVGPGGT